MTTSINVHGSIRRRFLTTLLLGALVLALGLFFIFQRLTIQLAEESQDNILRASAIAVLDSASVTQNELDLDLPYSSFSMLSNLANDRVYYTIRANGEFLTGYNDLPFPLSPDPSAPVFMTAKYQGETIRLVLMTRLLSAGDDHLRLTIAIGQTQDGQIEVLNRVLRTATFVGIGVFLMMVTLALFSAKTTISPLIRLAESVGRRGPNELRPVAAPVSVEMVPLVVSLNSFMERLQNSLARTEEFIAEAAHRLRTPLAIVRTRAETTLLRVEREENRAALKDMIRAIDESSRAAGQMLDHAMVTLRADHLERNKIDLAETIADLVERIAPTSELREIIFKTKCEANLNISGDTILIQSALRNVMDNALKFAPIDSTVYLIAAKGHSDIYISITDHGDGFPQENIENLTKRFTRGINAEGTVGSGLGLTIAADVMKAHGGSLTIKNNKGTGACVTLHFPLS